jgi:L-seryl-tRNA(Ser) seleniumtransferase
MGSAKSLLSSLPSVEKLLQSGSLRKLVEEVGHESVKNELRFHLSEIRELVAKGDSAAIDKLSSLSFETDLVDSVRSAVLQQFSSSMIPVINLSGTVVHTNLGRANLPQEAISAMEQAASYPCNLEYDLQTGQRGDRDSHLESVLCEITGAEAVTVVNNNAAAVLLLLNTLAKDKEVIISRGELVEIGGAFRIPDVMSSAGSNLREIGTTNRTHLRDYESAISDQTGLIMKVHTSNYEIRGFTKSVDESELARLARKNNISFASDLGSGSLVDLTKYGLPDEPTVQEVLKSGADIVTFSGDKLLGGPQAGIIVGTRELIDKIKANPLKRALRIDKITLAALLQVLYLYKDPHRIHLRLPLLVDLTRPLKEIELLAEELLPVLKAQLGGLAEVSISTCKSQIGSGALPLDLMESRALSIVPVASKGETDKSVRNLAKSFRCLPRPVIGRVSDGKFLLDLRCLRDVPQLVDQLELLAFP